MSGEDFNNGDFDDEDDIITKSIYGLLEYGELLQFFKTVTFTINGHENQTVFQGEEEVNGVKADYYSMEVVDQHGDNKEYEVWLNDDGIPVDATAAHMEGEEFDELAAEMWIGDALAPFFEFNEKFGYPIDYDDYTVDSHETRTDKLLQFDVIAHTIKGLDLVYHHSGEEVEYEAVVADAGQFEFLLEYIFNADNDDKVVFELTEIELR